MYMIGTRPAVAASERGSSNRCVTSSDSNASPQGSLFHKWMIEQAVFIALVVPTLTKAPACNAGSISAVITEAATAVMQQTIASTEMEIWRGPAAFACFVVGLDDS